MALTRMQIANMAATQEGDRALYEARKGLGLLGTGVGYEETMSLIAAGPATAGIGGGVPTEAQNLAQGELARMDSTTVPKEERIMGFPVGAIGALGTSLGIPAIGTIAAAGAGLYGIAQAFGLGEGEGIFGVDLFGGDTQYRDGIPFGGPGLAEPPSDWIIKEWHVSYPNTRLQYYLVQRPGSKSRKIAMYNTRTKKWKVWAWRKPHLAVIGKNMPSHKQMTRLKRNLVRHTADAKTLLKLVSPGSLKPPKRRRR